ncbi:MULTISPECIES: alpha/beta fold hydrolase [unclassified Bosea (in: a-proteobacteria)]|uniref:alpha/beta hydrolase n=1 Tax=unclassified Bosea (in: a-proteobacteria) TaxID=2653178 RepID=UPI0013DF358E|nr:MULTISPECIES: alpha/beta fold hydrolase [unclassified Bosea (in: a-proteobacteria)]
MTGYDIAPLDPREEHFVIPGPIEGLSLFLRHLPTAVTSFSPRRAVLYIHGATFPSALSIAHRYDGRSWRDALCEAGFDVWGFDFYGYGHSGRYPAMDEPASVNPPLGTTEEAALQVETATRFILSHSGVRQLSLIAHSWGSMPTCHFAGTHSDLIDRLVLFGPIARREPLNQETPPGLAAWRLITLDDQWRRFVEDVPAGAEPVLSRQHFAEWGERYLASDSQADSHDPASVKVPAGPAADIGKAWQGVLPYDPALIHAPVAIIRGEWDSLITDADARWLFDAFTASAAKRDIKISHGTHLMHLETMRFALWQESIAFLTAADAPTLAA